MGELTLVLMAAGRGSRYGGLKQTAKFGDQDATLAEFAMFDAIAAGFKNFVAIVNEDTLAYFEELFLKLPHGNNGTCVIQDTKVFADKVYCSNRKKPWGTGHAVLCAKNIVNGPFVVVNADDFYGKRSYELAASFLLNSSYELGLLAFKLENTLSPNGSVSRAICSSNDKNQLTQIKEHTSIRQSEDNVILSDDEGDFLSGEALVSLNFWMLSDSIFIELEKLFCEFLRSSNSDNEFYLPEAIFKISKIKNTPIKILKSKEKWFGVTYSEDKEWVAKELKDLNHYPSKLWKNQY